MCVTPHDPALPGSQSSTSRAGPDAHEAAAPPVADADDQPLPLRASLNVPSRSARTAAMVRAV